MRAHCDSFSSTYSSLTLTGATLRAQPDFMEQKCRITEILEAHGQICLFLPKYHCELNIIKYFWGPPRSTLEVNPFRPCLLRPVLTLQQIIVYTHSRVVNRASLP